MEYKNNTSFPWLKKQERGLFLFKNIYIKKHGLDLGLVEDRQSGYLTKNIE